MNIFITGTDTSIGKTLVSTALCLKWGLKYWKPIQSGTNEPTDSNFVKKYLDLKAVLQECYKLRHPLSPHTSAAREGVQIDLNLILERAQNLKNTIVEGAGGLLVPINKDYLIIDLIQKLKIRPLLVARSGLGTINHTLLSLEALRSRNIEPIGVVMIGDQNQSNKDSIEFYGKTKVLGEIPILKNFHKSSLIKVGNLIQLKGTCE